VRLHPERDVGVLADLRERTAADRLGLRLLELALRVDVVLMHARVVVLVVVLFVVVLVIVIVVLVIVLVGHV
jgi:hypothetical protein